MAILVFFLAHWVLSIFCQTFFLHRYSAHRMFRMSKGWERFFHFFTWFTQGSSYLQPRAYAILHRMHHAYSDTPKDPHSPRFFGTPFGMMWHTKGIYMDVLDRKVDPEPRFEGGYPEWQLLDVTLNNRYVAGVFAALYTLYYVHFATMPWQFLLLPIHFLMGPTQGAIVNWGGHKYGYRNFWNKDDSKNTLAFDLLTWGDRPLEETVSSRAIRTHYTVDAAAQASIGAAAKWLSKNPLTTRAEVVMVAYSPSRCDSDMSCTSCAVQRPLPKVKQASSTRYMENPRSPPARTVDSTELFVITPQTKTRDACAARKRSAKSVLAKALHVVFPSTVSPANGAVSGLKSWPAWPGRYVEFGSRESCRT